MRLPLVLRNLSFAIINNGRNKLRWTLRDADMDVSESVITGCMSGTSPSSSPRGSSIYVTVSHAESDTHVIDSILRDGDIRKRHRKNVRGESLLKENSV